VRKVALVRALLPLSALLSTPLLMTLLAGCGGDAPGAATALPSFPQEDVVSPIQPDTTLAAQVPADVRKAGVLRAVSAMAVPPGSFYGSDNKTMLGMDIDISGAAARVLGLRPERSVAAFEAILPGLDSGKYQVGTGNFGVTEVRKKTIDFATYLSDGSGFAVRKDSKLGKVTDLTQLCGLKVGTGQGTTFEAELREQQPRCAQKGQPPYKIQVWKDAPTLLLALNQGRIDAAMYTVNGLGYAIPSQQPNLKFLGEYDRLPVGFALKKGSPLAELLRDAVNKLIQDGTYAKITKKWRVAGSAITKSEVSPPENSLQ